MKYKIYYRRRKETIYFEISIPPAREVLISTGVRVEEKYWDSEKNEVKKSNRDHERLNLNLKNQKNRIEDFILKSQYEKRELTPKLVKENFERKSTHNIFEFVENYIQVHKNKRDAATLENYRKHIKKLEDYNGNKSLSFQDVDANYLRGYEEYLLVKCKLSENYASILFRTLKQMFLAAIKQKLVSENPFDNYERPKYKAPKKNHLTIPELYTLEDFISKTKNPSHKTAAIYFLFACYTGLRVSDWYNFDLSKHVQGNFIEIEAEKNGAFVNVPISRPLSRVLKLIRITPLDLEEQTINEKLKKIMEELKIHKKITTHCGRHTFAVSVCLFNKVSSETAAKIMGITLQTFVDNYSQVTQEKITRETSEAWKKLK